MKAIYIFSLFLFLPIALMSQKLIKGKIVDATTLEELTGVNVILVEPFKGTFTDGNGNYSLGIPNNAAENISLKISYLGYKEQVVELDIISPVTNHDITLQPNALQLQGIIVTANKKSEYSQKVPMSMSILSREQLERTGARAFRDYASGIPNLSFDTQGAGLFGKLDNGISIRGISGKNTTAMYLDETPFPENIDPRLADVNRVEILKGPQGTLYGSRNMGGAVKIITNQPNLDKIEGSMSLNVASVKEGNLDYGFQSVFNIPLGKKIAFRTVGYYDFETGIFDRKINPNANILNMGNTTVASLPDGSPFPISTDGCTTCYLYDRENIDDRKNYGFQASLAFHPIKNISITPKIIMQNQTGDGYDFAEGEVGNFEQIRISGVPEYYEDEWKHYSLTTIFNIENGKLISSTSLLDRNILEVDDDGESMNRLLEVYDGEKNLDFFAGNISKAVNSKQFNQEFRFQSDFSGKSNFTLGAFYMSTYEDERWLSQNTGLGSYVSLYIYEDPEFAEYIEEVKPATYEFGGIYESEEFALFGEIYYDLTEKLKATIGLRYFTATLDINSYETGFINDDEYFEVIGSVSESGINPKFNLSYKIDHQKLMYISAAKGYRLGDLNEIVPAVFCSEELEDLPNGVHPLTFESDFLWSYELGFKGAWANGKLMTNAAIFYNDWKNLQQNRTLECGYNFTSNVGSAQSTGLELEIKYKPSNRLELGTGAGLLNATITEGGPNLEAKKGDKILFTPNITANGYAQYAIPINDSEKDFYLRVDFQHVGERLNTFSPEDADNAHLIFDAYTILNARVGVEFAHSEFSIFAKNLTNTAANFGNIFSVATDIPGRPRFATNRPLTIGLQGTLYF